MNEPEEPARLLDDTSQPDGLRDVLRSARSDVGTDAQVARLAARLGPLLGPPVPPPHAGGGAAPGAAGTGLAGSAKLTLGALALVAAGGAWWFSSSAPPAEKARPSAAPVVQPPPAAVVPPANGTASGDAEPQATAAGAPRTSEPTVRPLPPKPTPPQAPSEAELLEQARSSLKGDPARALTRANEHRARFPRGVLVQEREVIAIQALRQLGRSAEAERRAEAFAKAFPGSAFQRKLKPSP